MIPARPINPFWTFRICQMVTFFRLMNVEHTERRKKGSCCENRETPNELLPSKNKYHHKIEFRKKKKRGFFLGISRVSINFLVTNRNADYPLITKKIIKRITRS